MSQTTFFSCPRCRASGIARWRSHKPEQRRAADLEKLTDGFVCREVGNNPPTIECSRCKIPVTLDERER
jgi:uncharacterized paraquat-inducible protein A